MERKDIESRFAFHSLNDAQGMKAQYIRDQTEKLAFAINEACPESREKSLSITHLEEVMFWANAAIARNT